MGGSAPAAASQVKQDEPRLRPARAADLSAVEAIELACFSSDPWTYQSFASLVGRAGVTFIVAEEGPEASIAGYAVLIRAAEEAELLNLAVSNESRRQGIGSALLRQLLDSAAAHGVRTVYLEVRESNAGARGLYGFHGFVEVGRRRGYYQRPAEDALILQRVEQ